MKPESLTVSQSSPARSNGVANQASKTPVNGPSKSLGATGLKTTPQSQRRSGNFFRNLFGSKTSLNGESDCETEKTPQLERPIKARRSKSAAAHPHRHGTVQIRTVEIVKRPGQNLGFYLRDGNGIDRNGGVFVSRIGEQSPLAKNSLIKAGDEILAVNAMPTSSMKIEDCVYIISLSSKLLITVRSVPYDSRTDNGQTPAGKEYDATPASIVINHQLQRERAMSLKKETLDGIVNSSSSTPAKIPPEKPPRIALDKEADDKEKAPLSPSLLVKSASSGSPPKETDATSSSMQRSLSENPPPKGILSDSEDSRRGDADDLERGNLSSSDENIHRTTLQKMEEAVQRNQFATLPKRLSPTSTFIGGPAPVQIPLLMTSSGQGASQFFQNKTPNRFRSVEEFISTETESNWYQDDSPRRLFGTDTFTRRSTLPSSEPTEFLPKDGCTCGHRSSSRPHPHHHHHPAQANNRGIVRPMNVDLEYEMEQPPISRPIQNCYTCIRFGAHHCPNHCHQRPPPKVYFAKNSNGYASDTGEDCQRSYSQRSMPRNHQPRNMAFSNHLQHQSFASSTGNIYDQDVIDDECFNNRNAQCWNQSMRYRSSNELQQSGPRRPNCLEIGRQNQHCHTDNEQDADDDVEFERLRAKRNNYRLQLLLMQQQQDQLIASTLQRNSAPPPNTQTAANSNTFPSFVDYRKVLSYGAMPQHGDDDEPDGVSGQLNLNLQAFYAWMNQEDAPELSTDPLAKPGNPSGLQSLYCSVFVDGRPVGKTAARIGLKSFYFNEIFTCSLSGSRYVSFVIYSHYGQGKAPTQRAIAVCPLISLCRKENTLKVAIQTYPSGVVFMRWLLKPVQSSQNQEQKMSENVAPPQDYSPTKPTVVKNPSSRKIFEVPLAELVETEWRLGLLSCHVPVLVQLCLRILNTCANVEGLYDRTSAQDERHYLRDCFEQCCEPKHLPVLCEKLMKFDCRVVADLLLDFLEELPEPLFSSSLAEDIAAHFNRTSQTEMSYIDRQMMVRQILLESSPKCVAETFQLLIDHIFLLHVNFSSNKLNSSKLESVFSPLIFGRCSAKTPTNQQTLEQDPTSKSSASASALFSLMLAENQIEPPSGQLMDQNAPLNSNNNNSSSLLLSPSTTASASSVASSASPKDKTQQGGVFSQQSSSVFVQLCEIMFPNSIYANSQQQSLLCNK